MNKKLLKVLLVSITVMSLVSWIYRLTEAY
jgi:hypothetical protein